MKRLVVAAACLACIPAIAPAQDKALETLCGDLFGARQTAIRLRDGGFSEQVTANETMRRPEWQSASQQARTLAIRVVQEVYLAPGMQNSEVIREVCHKAFDAPKAQ